jgi:UDP-glucuronate 4-epimerase
MAEGYRYLWKTEPVGLRFFSAYGPWGRPDMAMWIFADAIVEGRPVELFNHGNMQRDLTYIDDIVAGVVAALDHPSPSPVYNLGNHHQERIADVLTLIEEALGKKAQRVMAPMHRADIPAACANIDLARRELGYAPKTPVAEGVKRFIAWYREWKQLR